MEWNLIIFILFLWMLQLITTAIHWKHYQKTIKKMSSKSNGFLGVGMSKKKFLPRKIIVITTDNDGVINDCKVLSGLTVFSMFKKYDDFIGQQIHQIEFTKKSKEYTEAIEVAIQNIKREMEKGTSKEKQVTSSQLTCPANGY